MGFIPSMTLTLEGLVFFLMSVYHMHTWYLRRSEESVWSYTNVSFHVGAENETVALGEQQVFLTSQSTVQYPGHIFRIQSTGT